MLSPGSHAAWHSGGAKGVGNRAVEVKRVWEEEKRQAVSDMYVCSGETGSRRVEV